VLLGDDLIDPRETLLGRMLDVRDRYAGSVVALMEVPPSRSTSTAVRPWNRPGRTASSA
jgi:UTP-glucose-1-phosphate uridylyltransferase